MMAKRLIIKGRVQGVRYRVTFAETAIALGLAGWVRNRLDGSVEAWVHGDEDAIAAIVTWAKRGPPAARVSDVLVTESEEPMPKNKQFEVLDTR
jgi:acylphosphatase